MILSFKLKLIILLHTHTHPHTKGKERKEKKREKEKEKTKFLDGILLLFVVPSVFWFHHIEMVSTPSQAPFPWFCHLLRMIYGLKKKKKIF